MYIHSTFRVCNLDKHMWYMDQQITTNGLRNSIRGAYLIYIIISVVYGKFRKRLDGFGRAIARWNCLGVKMIA